MLPEAAVISSELKQWGLGGWQLVSNLNLSKLIMSQSIPTGYIPPGNPRENVFEQANPATRAKFFV